MAELLDLSQPQHAPSTPFTRAEPINDTTDDMCELVTASGEPSPLKSIREDGLKTRFAEPPDAAAIIVSSSEDAVAARHSTLSASPRSQELVAKETLDTRWSPESVFATQSAMAPPLMELLPEPSSPCVWLSLKKRRSRKRHVLYASLLLIAGFKLAEVTASTAQLAVYAASGLFPWNRAETDDRLSGVALAGFLAQVPLAQT